MASEPNYHSTKYISKDLLIMEMKKREVYMNKPIYLGQVVLDISKILMYEFWYDYLKPKYGDNIKLGYMDTVSFVIRIKTDDFYKDISNDINKWFDTSNYDKNIDRPFQKGINKKVIYKFKDELGGKIMSKFCVLRAKTYSFLIDDFTDEDYVKNGIVNKKPKSTKKCVVKHTITFNNYVQALFNDNTILRTKYTFRSDHHEVYKQNINKIALSNNDDIRIKSYDKITSYPYGYIENANDTSKTLLEEAYAIRKSFIDVRNELKILRNRHKLLKIDLKCLEKRLNY